MSDAKVLGKGEDKCPYCKKRIDVQVWKEIIEKAVAGVYETHIAVSAATQTKLTAGGK